MNECSVSKHIENLSVIEINNSLVVISFGGRMECHQKELLSHWRFIRTKQEDPDAIENPADFSEEDYEARIDVDSNFKKTEKLQKKQNAKHRGIKNMTPE
ncbi:hypothetical protein AVEN_107800-1 [Araneus ventricosus]|uniref:Uncharacterized protein n=1 Tax=Araneus ventricosus TaxID=182803 RepID=A0A4Y2WBX7_ARAVE|nr:hypothetical protein AVEN_107800-1 [Araneus ventricosus]